MQKFTGDSDVVKVRSSRWVKLISCSIFYVGLDSFNDSEICEFKRYARIQSCKLSIIQAANKLLTNKIYPITIHKVDIILKGE